MNDVECIIKIILVFTIGLPLTLVVSCVRELFYINKKAPQLLLDLESFCNWMFDV
ncbi:hypothetical protein FPN187_contig00041-0011 [Flavobacterium psychrophilum]|nr:hypothetical protein FPK15_contig00008-0007 [Flavobacterium psychrophilum]GEJ31053.1 hypothetical protein FPN186_contig00132-0011 [Flavobacterium psychrophilum]GEJ31187.1 hypothetical protein FPN185_contig00050-0011 [Flavobacterium psychrophilum]GEJ33275.1 hypothetical protein FPN181_contig00017-0009 [Flavobacterium psychrophilum]GEJ38007.1 hypothetical protein FPN187_contig00041-0011 [Flavobacterium psychrophilum]